ncbi:MAG: FG-GAP-like repeat-containing protein, partial [Candidatus Latescibacterota bacterium]
IISIDEGGHLVTLYSPGYEPYQEYIQLTTGSTAVIDATLIPVMGPVFSSEEKIQAAGADIDAGDRTAPYLIDWNDDGLVDLLVGNSAGDILAYINTNTNSDPQYGASLTVLSATGVNATPIALEFYHLRKKQLVVGYQDGSVDVYLNTGTDDAPAFAGDPYDSTLVVAPSGNAAPFIVDWDNDGKKDLLVGCADGNVYLYQNRRVEASPAYSGYTVLCSVSSNASPAAVLDWDGDGNKDLVVGDADGAVSLFLNVGTDDAPVMGIGTPLTSGDGTPIDVGTFARPIVADYNHDGVKDLVVGTGDGNVLLFGESTNEPPVADAGGPYSAECQGSMTMLQLDGSGSSDPDGDELTYSWTSDCPGASFDDATSAAPVLSVGYSAMPVMCNVTLTVSDGTENAGESVTIEVVDTTPPDFSLSVTPDVLWPPNHKMVEVTPTIQADDICCGSDIAVDLISVQMNEGETEDTFDPTFDINLETGFIGDDIQISTGKVYVRAERSGKSDGRVYTITYQAMDCAGNTSTASVTVTVPHDMN